MFRKSNRKNLTINIEESDTESAEDQFNSELETLVNSFIKSTNPNVDQFQIKEYQALISKENAYLTQLYNYMQNENYKSDLSYKFLLQNQSLKKIAEPIFFSPEINQIPVENMRNIQAEFSILKQITGTKAHKDLEIAIPKYIKRNENRYRDMLPFQYNIVNYEENPSMGSLNEDIMMTDESQALAEPQLEENKAFSSYINASFIDGPFQQDEKMFIAAQGPMKNTIHKFYSMCFIHDVKLIIMLCPFEEVGRSKCQNYLPNELNQIVQLEGDLEVVKTSEEWIVKDSLIRREIYIRKNGIIKSITHLQAIDWPDCFKPNSFTGTGTIYRLLKFIGEFRDIYPSSPVLIHCIAGTGRTGTLISIVNLVKCLSFFNYVNYDRDILPFFSVFNTVRKLREQRSGMVSSIEQYTYIYEFIQGWITKNNYEWGKEEKR